MMRKHRFTLIELLTVMAIIAILASLILGTAVLAIRKSREGKTISKLQQMTLALEEYKRDRGHYPVYDVAANPNGIRMSGAAPFNDFDDTSTGRTYLDGYKEGNPFEDGWNEQFYYRYPGRANTSSFDLWSAGNDRKTDATYDTTSTPEPDVCVDDVANWRQNL